MEGFGEGLMWDTSLGVVAQFIRAMFVSMGKGQSKLMYLRGELTEASRRNHLGLKWSQLS